jgi:unsaturated chondroitin disaccharide hydrolase
VADESCFIDIMMNVGIIFWAADHADDEALRQVAEEHCETSRRYLVRGDGSTAHEAIFDLDSGECLRQTTHQGFRGDSCWVRGLAWSLYGFGTAFSHTHNESWLHTAELNAECFLRHLPADGVTPYDFFANGNHVPLDTSGSAIAASGLWQLAELTPSRYRAKRYREAAVRMVDGLCQSHLGDAAAGWEGILRDQIYHIHLALGVGESCMFGDYFFVEALGKVLDGLERGVI